MDSLSWIALLCQGWRKSQIKTFTALLQAFIGSSSCILNEIARKLTAQTGIGVDHTLKRLSRFLANERIVHRVFYQNVVSFVWPRIQHWKIVPVAIDWTYCEQHDPWQSLVASIVVRGRGIPILVWSFPRDHFAPYNSQNQVEDAFVKELRSILPCEKRWVMLADRGFARTDWFHTLVQLGFDFVVRLKHTVHVHINERVERLGDISVARGQIRSWSQVNYRQDAAFKLARLVITRPATEAKGKKMDPWFLGTTLPYSPERIVQLYTKRMTVEEDFRTAKSTLGWKHCRIRKLKHYRQLVLLMVAALVLGILIGLATLRKPSLVKGLIRKRKGRLDTCASQIGLRLLALDFRHLTYLALMRCLPSPV